MHTSWVTWAGAGLGAALIGLVYWGGVERPRDEPEWQENAQVKANEAKVVVGISEEWADRLLGSADETTVTYRPGGKSVDRKVWYVKTYHSPHYPGTRQPAECLEVTFSDGKVSAVKRTKRIIGL
jgi:hypothetical protein